MNKFYCLLALGVVVPVSIHYAYVANEPAGSAEVALGKKKEKKPRDPPAEADRLEKVVEKMARPAKTELDVWLKLLQKVSGGGEQLDRPEAGDAEFHGWFDRLCGGSKVWREADIEQKAVRAFFSRIADRLEIGTGEISRDEFLRYAREYLKAGESVAWEKKPAKSPQNEAGKFFEKLDRNRDGVLSGEELSADLRGELERWDADRDGKISEQEYARYFEAKLRVVAKSRGVHVPGIPKEEPGRLEASRERPIVHRPGRMPAGLPGWFRDLDSDSDGQIGLYEWKAGGRSVDEFLRLDLNEDGFVTVEEWQRSQRTGLTARR